MTRDQKRATELIGLIEGTNLTCEESDYYLTIVSETGQRYVVARDGKWRCNNGRRGDTTDLEMEVDEPMWYAPPEPADMPDHRELAREISPPLTDYHSDRLYELWEEGRRIESDADYYRRREAA